VLTAPGDRLFVHNEITGSPAKPVLTA